MIRQRSSAVHDLRALAVNSSHDLLQETTPFKFASFCNESPLHFNNGFSCAAKASSPSSTCTAMTRCKPSKVSRWPGREMRERRLTNGTRTSARRDASTDRFQPDGRIHMSVSLFFFFFFFAFLEYMLIPEYSTVIPAEAPKRVYQSGAERSGIARFNALVALNEIFFPFFSS